jgi:2-dehydro-3-deoxyphosphogluconate aldolase/(4S)-4-hydroxy-2-oxoglutarate aldolase
LRSATIVPVLTIQRVDQAVPLARALVAGGVRTLEVTLRTSAGAEAAKAMKAEVPEAIVGLGTVTRPQDLDLCRAMGLSFAFSPGASPALLDAAAQAGLDFVPGIQTASDIMACLERGFDVMKFFPAVPAGGIAALKALAGPFPQVKFCPTGGITEDQAGAWLKLPNVLAVGGSWLAPTELMEAGEWAAITDRARRSIEKLTAPGA